jgi:hypothetical protein
MNVKLNNLNFIDFKIMFILSSEVIRKISIFYNSVKINLNEVYNNDI